VALTAERVNQLLAWRGKIKANPNPQPPTGEELTQMRLRLDRTVLFPPRGSGGRRAVGPPARPSINTVAIHL